MKRKIALLCLVAALLSMASVGSYAYYSYTATATNVISTGGVDIALHETTADGSTYTRETITIMPGDTVSKIARVENTGAHPAYVRVKLTAEVNDASLTASDCISLDINTASWTVRDGYYYYNTALEAGRTTEPLFTQVSFIGEKVTNEYLGKLFSLDVAAFAVQSEHNGASPFVAQGWPEG